MLPFWTENEITREDTIEILQEYERNEGKGRIMMDVNKTTQNSTWATISPVTLESQERCACMM